MIRFLSCLICLVTFLPFFSGAQIDDSTLNKLSDTLSYDKRFQIIIGDGRKIQKTDPAKSLEYCLLLEKDTAKVENRIFLASLYRLMAHSYGDLNNRPATLKSHLRRQEVLKNPKTDLEKKALAAAYFETAAVLSNQEDYDLATPYYEKCISLCGVIGDTITQGQAMIELGILLANGPRKDEAIDLIIGGAKPFRNSPYTVLVGYAQIEAAKIYLEWDDIEKSWAFADSAIKNIGDPNQFPDYSGLVFSGAGEVLLKAGNYSLAIENFERAKTIMEKYNKFFYLPSTYRGLSRAYRTINSDSSIKYLEQYVEMNDSVLTVENNRKIAELQIIHDEEENKREIRLLSESNRIKEKEKRLVQKDNERQKAQNNRQKQIIAVAVVALILVLGSLFFVFRLLNVSKKQNRLIANQKKMVEKKNKEIHDSIDYAQRIQTAIIPDNAQISKLFPDHFVLYMPKDKLSGDFYWCGTAVNNAKQTLKVFSVGDCTGHGIPGALVSILGLNYLKLGKSDKSVNSPAQALDFLNQGIFSIFESEKETIRDGMDISIAAIDESTMTMYYAAAKNPIFVVRNKEIKILKGDKHPIGKSDYDHPEPFTDHSFELQKNDMIYMCSDGYQDQFGGPRGKKFKIKNLKALMVELSAEESGKQKEVLKDSIESWKGDLEQIDDICILGIRV